MKEDFYKKLKINHCLFMLMGLERILITKENIFIIIKLEEGGLAMKKTKNFIFLKMVWKKSYQNIQKKKII